MGTHEHFSITHRQNLHITKYKKPYSNMSNNTTTKIQETQAQVQDVIGVMQDNVARVIQRGDNLEDLSSRADSMQMNAREFQAQGTAIRKKMWWKNMKMMIIIGVTVAVVILIIILSTTLGGKNDDDNADGG